MGRSLMQACAMWSSTSLHEAGFMVLDGPMGGIDCGPETPGYANSAARKVNGTEKSTAHQVHLLYKNKSRSSKLT